MATNLQFIKSASGSSVSSLSVTDCFSSEYDVYQVLITKSDISATDYAEMRFIDSGGVDSTANYDLATLEVKSYTSFNELRATGQTSFQYMWYSTNGSANQTSTNITIYNPNNSRNNSFKWC
jgi:hypothetical protein